MNSTSIENLALSQDDTQSHQQISLILDLRFFLVRIFYPCLLIWGTIGNALCLRVLLSKKFNKNSTCQYLAILAVIDILFIVFRSSKHVYKLFRDTPIFNTSKWICRILTFSSSAIAHIASWILVVVSFDRYLIVTSRYRRHSSAANRVLCSTSILIAIVALCNLYYFFILGRSMSLGGIPPFDHRRFLLKLLLSPNDTSSFDSNESVDYPPSDLFRSKTSIFVCIPSSGYERFFRTYIPIFDILLVAVIPFILLCFTNIGIIIYTMRTNRRMRHVRKRAHRRHQRLTIMLLSVTLAFIGLTCPSVIFICANKIIYSGSLSADRKHNSNDSGIGVGQPPNVQIIVDICEALWYTKHAMNFILYTLSGQDFRREFLKLFTQCFNRRSFIIRKLLSKTRTTTEPTVNVQLPIDHQKKSKKQSITDTYETIPSAVLINSTTIQFKTLSGEKELMI